MRQIYGYGNMRRVVGIQSTNSTYYYNNRYYRRQQERQNAREQRKQKEFVMKKPQPTNEVVKTYRSTDAKIIYFQEYCKVRNTKIYGQLNPNVNTNTNINIDISTKINTNINKNTITNTFIDTNIINYSSRYPQYASSRSVNVNRMLEAYSQMSRGKNVIIDFEERKARRTTNNNSNNNRNKPASRQEVKPIMTKKDEMDKFKQSLKNQPKTDLDIAAEKFEEALRKRNEYDAELRKQGYRVFKGRKNSGLER